MGAEQFAYAYDPIGNRTEYDVGVQDPSDTDYEANQLNQYLRAVTDDPNVAQGYRHDEDGNLIEAFVAADMNCDGAIDSFDVSPFILAMTNPTLYEQTYPNCNILNGDLNGDGAVDSFDLDLFTALLNGSGGATGLRVEYTWNAENRLTDVTPVSPQAGDKKVEFAYDYMGRRIEKKVYDWDDQAEEWEATPSLRRKFVWSGWLMLMELDALDQDAAVRKYTWGLDLSQTLTGAGGIGGLLAVHDVAEEDDYVYLYDANGNVGQVLDLAAASASAAIKAHYEYDPYGNIVNDISGYAYAEENPYRFSTKPFDNETGMYYFGYRYYSPTLGRWMSWDPNGERGWANLYAALRNNPFAWIDPDGGRERPTAGTQSAPSSPPATQPSTPPKIEPASQPASQPCCLCGPDITKAVEALMKDIDAKFRDYSRPQIGAPGSTGPSVSDLCEAYIGAGTWDSDLFTVPTQFKTANCPKGGKPCALDFLTTGGVPGRMGGMPVTFKGACYASFDVNYVVYGRMARNCQNISDANFWFDMYKSPLWTEHTVLRYDQARQWYIYAYADGNRRLTPPANLKICAPCDEEWKKPIRWRAGTRVASISGDGGTP